MFGGGNGRPPGGGKGIPPGGGGKEPPEPGVGGNGGIPLGGNGGMPFGGKGNGGMPGGKPLGGIPPGAANGGGIPGGRPKAAAPLWVPPGSIGFALAWPSAAYEDVIESMTDCAFSWPISMPSCQSLNSSARWRSESYVGNSRLHCVSGCDRCCEPCARSSSRG